MKEASEYVINLDKFINLVVMRYYRERSYILFYKDADASGVLIREYKTYFRRTKRDKFFILTDQEVLDMILPRII